MNFKHISVFAALLLTGTTALAQNGFNVRVLTRQSAAALPNGSTPTPAGFQHVVVQMTANRRVPAAGNGDWGSAAFIMRVPKTLNPTPLATYQDGVPSTQIINGNNSGFNALRMADQISGAVNDIRPFDGPSVGAADDGFIYWILGNNSSQTNVNYALNTSFKLLEFDVPTSWNCPTCMEIVTPAMNSTVVAALGADPQGVMNFSEGALGNQNQFNLSLNSQPLPVKLMSFEARKADNSRVQLNWQTSMEQGTDYFEVERSGDGNKFTTVVRRMVAAGTSATPLDYQTYDNEPKAGVNYYRLKMVDVSGAATYSSVRSVNFGDVRNYSMSPNPASEVINVKGMDAGATIVIMTTTGQKVSELKAASAAEAISLNNMVPGMYYLQIVENGHIVYNNKFTKQ